MTSPPMLDGTSFARIVEHIPAAFAVTQGVAHTVVYSNAAFRRMIESRDSPAGRPITDALPRRVADDLTAVLDEVAQTGVVARDRVVPGLDEATTWCCTAWPAADDGGERSVVVVELRATTAADDTLALQRELAERMLLSALRERDAATSADMSRSRATFLAVEARRLAGSLDPETTLHTIAGLALPQLGAWCIVDVVREDASIRRLAIIHPDLASQHALDDVANRWLPHDDDMFGVPAARRTAGPTVLTALDFEHGRTSHDPELLNVLMEVGVGPMLTMPLSIRDRVVGAITFVAGGRDHVYTREDLELAEDLATRSAVALDSSRQHSAAIESKVKAEAASQVKSAFLGSMSHELRTPLNAIGGYVDLIDMGLRGPVTEAQHTDLGRIRRSQQHLTGLVNDILNLVRIGSGGLRYTMTDVDVDEVLASGIVMVEPLAIAKGLVLSAVRCTPAITVRADHEKLTQILVNLLSNAIKFTPRGGTISLTCDVTATGAQIHVADTGIGIPADSMTDIFEPFVQVRSRLTGEDNGVGLGLAISRDLARGMGGDLTVESEVGVGTTLTVTLQHSASAPVGAGLG